MNPTAYSASSAQSVRSFLPELISSQIDELLVYPEVTSTNDVLWKYSTQNPALTAVCLADSQTQGRGRRGGVWHSPASGNLYLSMLRPFETIKARDGLSIALGISLINSLKKFGIKGLQLKWPNDILVERQKLAGILIESRVGQHAAIVIGLGLNYDLSLEDQQQIPQAVISLRQLCDDLPCRNQLGAAIIENMLETLNLFSHRGLIDFLPQWSSYDALKNQPIHIISEQGQITALACGINEQGELRYMHNQQLNSLSNSHVSIRFAS